jgi:TetR/AcrR family transcriptional regulator
VTQSPLPAARSLGISRPPRRERNADSTKKALLNAAEVEFAAKGFDGARLQSIARMVGVQQALIHHYFDDKEGIYRAVIERGLAAVTAGSWTILERLAQPADHKKDVKAKSRIRALVTSFVDLLVDFYAEHTSLLAILRHDAQLPVLVPSLAAPGDTAPSPSELRDLLATHIRPVFEAVALQVKEFQKDGKIREDVDPQHLCVSMMAMACLPFQETQMLNVLWPEADFRSERMVTARKHEIIETVLARVLV